MIISFNSLLRTGLHHTNQLYHPNFVLWSISSLMITTTPFDCSLFRTIFITETRFSDAISRIQAHSRHGSDHSFYCTTSKCYSSSIRIYLGKFLLIEHFWSIKMIIFVGILFFDQFSSLNQSFSSRILFFQCLRSMRIVISIASFHF